MLAVRRQTDGPESAAVVYDLTRLGLCLLRRQKWADAEATARECLAVGAKAGADPREAADTRSVLGAALAGQGKDAEALERLVGFYAARGKTEKAAEYQKELDRVKPPGTAPEAKKP